MDPKLLAAAFLLEKKKKKKTKSDKSEKSEADVSSGSRASSSFQSFSGSSAAAKRKAEELEAEKEVAAVGKRRGLEKKEDQTKIVEHKEEADWSNAPETLRRFGDFSEKQSLAFVEHWVRFMVGQWRHALQNKSAFKTNVKGGSEAETASFRSQDMLKETEAALAPLMKEIQANALDEGGAYNSELVEVRVQNWGGANFSHMVKASDVELDNVTRAKCMKHIVNMCKFASEQEYEEANKVYMKMALGNKKWHQTHASFAVFRQNKGTRLFKTIQDQPNTYDVDPIAQKYIWAVRKLVHLAQLLLPNDDISKHMCV